MRFRVVTLPHAEREMIDAYDYIARDSPRGAETWYLGVRAAIRALADFPRACSPAREAHASERDLRQTVYKSYRIIFEVDDQTAEVRVLHVRHTARRNWQPDAS